MSLTLLGVAACVKHYRPPTDGGAGDDLATAHDLAGAADAGSASPDLASACGDRATECGGACVDLSSDASNCGACGNACAVGETCAGGACGRAAPMGCNAMVSCLGNCGGDGNCANACLADGTPKAQMLFQAVGDCLAAACPTGNGGVCDSNAMGYDPQKCDDCAQAAIQPNGACGPQLNACLNDR